MNWDPFKGVHLILVWNEVKISGLQETARLETFTVEVHSGDPNKSTFMKGVKGEVSALGRQAHMPASLPVSGCACQSMCCHRLPLFASILFITWAPACLEGPSLAGLFEALQCHTAHKHMPCHMLAHVQLDTSRVIEFYSFHIPLALPQ